MVVRTFLALGAALLLSACGVADKDSDQGDAATEAAQENAAPPTESAKPEVAAAGEFDIASIPVSTAALGEFPFFSLPAGYEPTNKPKILDFGYFPFWTGKALHKVEGKVYMTRLSAEDGKDFSSYEVRRNLETLIERVGGVKVTESKIPGEITDELPDEVTVGMNAGLGNIYSDPVVTWVIRQKDREIWVHTTNEMKNLTIVETKAFEPTARMLPATALKRDLDATGKATIHVNFATDKADILPASRPQLDEVVALLKGDPKLKLSVEGHTDNSGSAVHNMTLSKARAASVVAALTGAGIVKGRLMSQGFGDTRPVADNATDTGRAANRRVQLVKV